MAAPVDLRTAQVEATPENGFVKITLNGGGAGTAYARDGITPAEIALMQKAMGKDAFCPQTVATEIFGRVNGQYCRGKGVCPLLGSVHEKGDNPILVETDLEMYINTIVESYRLLHDRMPEANDQLQKRAISTARINHIENIALKDSKQT